MTAAGRPSSDPFPWENLIGFGFGVLRLSPQAFWSMTPRELALAIEAVRAPSVRPMDRDAFAALMSAFPDHAR